MGMGVLIIRDLENNKVVPAFWLRSSADVYFYNKPFQHNLE